MEPKSRNPIAGETLEAVKWIGNQGSHTGSITASDVLAGAELLTHALKILYDETDKEVAKKVRLINRAKGIRTTKVSKRRPAPSS